MKKLRTLIWLRISVILQIVFAALCTSTVICVFAYKLLRQEVLLFLSIVSMYGRMINPAGLVTLILGLTFTFIDCRSRENRAVIGCKWIWFVLFAVLDTLLYCFAGGSFVAVTGGV